MRLYPLLGGKLGRALRVLCCVMIPALAGAAETEPWVADANNAFATAMYAKLAASEHGNLFLSPASIETALAMTIVGARGETETQMASVLHLPANGPVLQKEMGNFIRRLNGNTTDPKKKRPYQLSIANALWAQSGYAFLPGFLPELTSDYMAGIREIDYASAPEAARSKINSWVANKTGGKITDLIRPGLLTKSTRLVLTNAIYFKGIWTSPFDKAATKPQPFHSTGSDKSVPMMQRIGEYGYMDDAEMQALKLDYAGGDLSMVILLPREMNGLPHLEQELTPAKLTSITTKIQEQRVVVAIPRFTMTHAFELGDTLQAIGMTDAFSGAADFSGMTGKRDFSISNVIHKAYVDVNEQGTEAAAATGVEMRNLAVFHPKPPPVFRADHPFLFVIREESSGAILFMGRLADPE